MPAVKTVRRWEYDGASYDQEKSDELEMQIRLVLDQYTDWWKSNVPDYSWSSPKQLIELFTSLGVKVPRRKRVDPKTKAVKFTPSVDEEALENIRKAGGPSAEIAKLIQLLREHKKATDFMGLGQGGKITCRAKVCGQAGGRIQLVKENLQQWPDEIAGVCPRETIVPDDRRNDVIISADFSQIEFWLYSWYAKCKRALEIKASGDYLYGGFYEDIWKEPFFNPTGGRNKSNCAQSVPPWKLLVAKSWPLGFIYGRGVPNPAEQGLPISTGDARRIHDSFHVTYPEYRRFHHELEFLVTRYGYLQTAFGRLRRFSNPKGQRNEYLAFPGQSSAVDVLLGNALNPLSLLLPKRFEERSRVLFTVHDSVICNVTTGGSLQRAEEAYYLVKETLEQPIAELEGFSIPCEVKIGPSWGQGMRWQSFEQYWKASH
jgi:DNA polymerase I-like protein with 3'-5' exonuclease and polymerase domains